MQRCAELERPAGVAPEQAAQKLATDRFIELAQTEGFVRMDEVVLGRLLDDDGLVARN